MVGENAGRGRESGGRLLERMRGVVAKVRKVGTAATRAGRRARRRAGRKTAAAIVSVRSFSEWRLCVR